MSIHKKSKQRLDNQYVLSKKIMDFGMGIIYVSIGCFIFISKAINFELSFPKPPLNYFFGLLIFIYGSFRLYRVWINKKLK